MSLSLVKLPVRKVPIAVRGQFKEELDCLSNMEIIDSVDVPTNWISSMVVATKRNGQLRLCMSYRSQTSEPGAQKEPLSIAIHR